MNHLININVQFSKIVLKIITIIIMLFFLLLLTNYGDFFPFPDPLKRGRGGRRRGVLWEKHTSLFDSPS